MNAPEGLQVTLLEPGIFTVAEVFAPDECAALIARSEQESFATALVGNPGSQVLLPQIRNNDRVDLCDPALRQFLWERMRAALPAELDGFALVGLHPRLRFYRYDPGQRFKLHMDGWVRGEGEQVSRLTCLVYLNENFEGGATIFHQFRRVAGQQQDQPLVIQPRIGLGLIFVHERWHEGEELRSGRKYVLRADVLYAGAP